ncbi:MAG: energy transducer TonB [Desulfomonile tiedjei]|nr:energy transducer TonB [Desulfomonile tiedjei]
MSLDYCENIDDSLRPEEAARGSEIMETSRQEKILKYCIIASCILHVGFFVALPHLSELTPTKALLKPGETVTSVRLVEPQTPNTVTEPPPENASAISDRDHTAERPRLPKSPPAPKPPLGNVQPMEKRMASLVPPPAPEDLVKPREEPTKKDVTTKAPPVSEKANSNHSKHRDQTDPLAKKNSLNKRPVDLTPTLQDIAKGFSSPGGATDFYPDGDLEEAVVDINTREDRFFSYLWHLKQKIQGVWVYPAVAAKSGIGGALSVEFSVSKEGELLYVNLVDSSGHTILDESAMKAIRSAAPYFPFPPRLKAKRLRVRANFIYVTGNAFRSIM